MAGSMKLSLIINADGTAAIRGLNQLRGSLTEVGQVTSRVEGQMAGLVGQLKSLAMTAGAALGVSSLAQSFTAANAAAGAMRATLETVTGSVTNATAAWGMLQDFAATTPFSLEQATNSFIKLKALGLDPSREALLSYANTASAMGQTLEQMALAVGDAVTGQFERLLEFGVKASKDGDQVVMTFQGVTTTIGNNAAEIEAYLQSIGNVQFAGAIERQSETLGVALSNVGDSFNQLLVEIGDAGLSAAMAEGLRDTSALLDNFRLQIADGLGGEATAAVARLTAEFSGWTDAIGDATGLISELAVALGSLPDYAIVIRDGTLALEEQGTLWKATVALVQFAGQAFLDLPDNLTAAVHIILGEIDILAAEFAAGFERLPLIASATWTDIVHFFNSGIATIKVAVAEMVAFVAGQLASLATDMAAVMAQVPEALDIGGMASAAAASLDSLATSLNTTEAAVASLKAEQAALGVQYAKDTEALKGQQQAITARTATEVAGIREVIAAGIDEAEANKARRKAQADLNGEFALAVAEQARMEKQWAETNGKISDGKKKTTDAAKSTKELASAKSGASAASKQLAKAQREENQAIQEAERAVEALIARYLPARAAAEDYAEAQAAIAAALAGKAGSVALSAAEASQILAGLANEQAQAADAARRESDAFYAAWADAVDSLDDTFQSLWRGLITGQGDVLGNLKETVLEWVADLSYQLLLSPLIVPIQGALMGMMGGGAAGVTGTATSLLGGASSLSNAFSGFSSLASGISNVFSGAALTGIMDGFGAASSIISAQGYFGGFGANMAMASGAAGTGSTSFAIGAAMPYLLPAAAIAAIGIAVLNKWQSDQEPRYGTLAAMTGGSAAGLEDSEWGAASGAYVQGSFGLSFGLTDKGSKNMEATELTEVYQALADVSDALAEFFGEDLSSFIEAELQRMSDFGDGLIHLTENEGDLGGAMAALVERIALAAGRSADDIGIAFGAMVGDLSGTAEEVGQQIQAAMVASTMAVDLSDRFAEPLGQMLALTGDITTDVGLLKGHIDVFGASGESSAETLARLTAQVGLLDAAAAQTATDLEGLTATALLTLSDDLVSAFGGIEAATQAQAFYYDQFTTGTEKLVDAIQAAADQLDRKIPKLQDELMKLGEDVTTAVVAIAADLASTGDAIASSLSDVTRTPIDLTPLYQTIDEGLSGSGQWAETHAASLRQQAENWAKSIADWDALFGVDTPFLLEVASGLEQYGSTLEQFGYVVDEGAQAFLDSLRQAQQAAAEVGANGELPTETITTPGDPNAAILAELLNDLPKTREGFEALIGAIDLTTEAGRKLYAGLLELAPQFDLLYDGAEAFTDWLLGVDDVGTALRELERVFSDWGMSLPQNRDDLLALYASGTLTTEQMAILGAYLSELGLVFGDLGEGVNGLNAELDTAMAALQRAVAAEKAALAETHEARMKALNAELEAANEALGDAQSLLNTVQGALNTLESAQGVSANEINAALAQLSAWATSGVTPDQEALSDTLATLSAANASDYATAADYQAVQDQQYAALLALEQQGLTTVDTAQATVDALEAQLEQEAAFYEAEIERLDDLLASAEDQIALAEGTYAAALSVDEALAQLNALLAGSGAPAADDPGTAGGTSDTPGGAPGSGSQEQTASLEAIRAEIAALRADLAAVSSASQARLINLDDTLTKWDKDGLPAGDSEEITLLRAA